MGNENYYEFAENDYQMILFLVKNEQVRNGMCTMSQNICEKYLKHIIDKYIRQTDENFESYTFYMRTHNLRSICRFIKENLSDFDFNTNKICQADGYYFSSRYPGRDSSFVDKDDVESCWEAVQYTKTIVDDYISNH